MLGPLVDVVYWCKHEALVDKAEKPSSLLLFTESEIEKKATIVHPLR